MEPSGAPRAAASVRRALTRLAWVGAAGLVVLLLLAPLRAEAPAWGDPAPGLAWSNGAVLCQFFPARPFVNASSPHLPGTGLVAGLGSIYEERAGAVVALASATQANWSVANLSSEQQYTLRYTAQLPELSVGGPALRHLATVSVAVSYALPAYATSSSSLDTVLATATLSGWTWASANDLLVLALPLAPADPASEKLVAGPEGSVGGVAISDATPHQRFTPGSTIDATPRSGPRVTVPVNLSSSVSPASATVSITIGPGAAAFTTFAYSAQISIVPATLAGIPIYEFAAVGAGAALVVAAVAVGTRRIRRRPSSLEFIEEEA